VAIPTGSVSQNDPPALVSQLAPCSIVTHVCTASTNATHTEQQHDSLQKGASSIDACGAFFSVYVPSEQHETPHNDDDGAVLNSAPYPRSCRCSSNPSTNGDCNTKPGHRNHTAGMATLIANVGYTTQ
ncbi:unnamed protein product, partial [Sphacelaria rigidula]